MRKLDYEAALAAFETLLRDARPDDERITLMLYSGAARALLGDDGGARVAFEAALRIDAHSQIPFKTSPKVLALFDDVRASLPPREPASRDVEPSPEPPQDPTPPLEATPTMVTAESPTPSQPTVAPQAPPGPTALDIVGVGAGVLAAGLGIAAGAFGFDVAAKMQVANARSTSQVTAKALVAQANTSLTFAGLLGAGAVASAGAAVAAFVWPETPADVGAPRSLGQ
jgi:hypothetical protein